MKLLNSIAARFLDSAAAQDATANSPYIGRPAGFLAPIRRR
jgi:hypothetical protein